ncbi:MAG: S-ribosylhomocysteine lyase [Lachnospiraceae bacterium]|nr:S-ribosylhomocysteine lyase [Lachnospiraceae bacterium]
MKPIASFTINHETLLPGVYVSRKDLVNGQTVTTFDIRMTAPNREPVMNTAEVHTIEHLAATFLRNHPVYGSRVLYFGPMGCRTGFYLLLAEDADSKDVVPLMKELFAFMADYEGAVPGADARSCGNYLDMNLPMARLLSRRFLNEVLEHISEERLVYPN